MKIIIKKLFEVQIFHQFYANGISHDFAIVPTRETNLSIKKYYLFFRTGARGFSIYFQTINRDGHETCFGFPFAAEEKLSFALVPQKPHFLNYTALTLDDFTGKIIHLHNKTGNKQNSDLLLSSQTANKFVDVTDAQPLHQRQFTLKPTSLENLAIKNQLDEILPIEAIANTSKDGNLTLNLTNYPAGKFELGFGTDQKYPFYASDFLHAHRPFAVIDIFLNLPASNGYALFNGTGVAKSPVYKLHFDRRATTWRYNVMAKFQNMLDLQTLNIEHPDAVAFSKGPESINSEGIKTIVFESNTPIPLQEKPASTIKLKKSATNGGSDIDVATLPTPDVNFISPDKTTNKIYSDIFVYI